MACPTITALMVTLGRTELVKESYKYFREQTYPAKKLLVVTDGEDREHEFLKSLARLDKNVTVLHVGGPRKILGELRNLSIKYSPSDLSIQWDDDDWYGPTRIMDQFKGLGTGQAVMLQEQLHYFRDTNQVAWTVDSSGVEGTLLLDRRCGLKYPLEKRGEDTVLKKALQVSNLLNLVPGGTCYCRTYHGNNTWDREHHVRRVQEIGKKQLDKEKLLEAAKFYNWKKGWKII